MMLEVVRIVPFFFRFHSLCLLVLTNPEMLSKTSVGIFYHLFELDSLF